ncbi:MAG: 30S ribosomal protein S6e [Nanoarchaeota archaeon]|nr:30S ribosomal protein S6e [Nanoarchaeota archaeon]
MPFKINISEKGKTFKLEADTEFLIGKKIGEKISGKELKPELDGYELEITGSSDKAGFPGMKEVEGLALKKVLLKKGFGMKNSKKGIRLKKTVRGNTISKSTIQINIKVLTSGNKKLEEIFKGKEENKEQVEEKSSDIKEEKESK